MACTTLLVGKEATYDGSTIVARNEDSGAGEWCPKKMIVVEPEDQPRHYRSVLSHVEIELPDDPMRYTALPNAIDAEGIWASAGVNTANVSMSATETLTSNPRVLGADPLVELVPAKGTEGEDGYVPEQPGGIGEEDMVTLVLPYIHSAREGVQRLGDLLTQFGTYEMNGIAFSDCDEIWWLETVGGHHWIARRVPDTCYVTVPNQLGIDAFDLADAEGPQLAFMASADLRAWMAEHHLDLTLHDDDERHASVFNPREAFGSHSDADHVYNTPRAWAMQRYLNPRSASWDGKQAEYRPEDDDIPWCRVPEHKVTIEEVKDVLSLHYQGTVYDAYGRYAEHPMNRAYRPIGINRNSQLCIAQLKGYAADAVKAIQWISFGSNVFNASVPFFANVDEIPEYLANTEARVTSESFYWANRLVAAMADAHFNACLPHIERYQELVASKGHAIIGAVSREVSDAGLDYAEASERLQQANAEMAAFLKEQTDDLLGKVLETVSNNMRNGFARSDS